LTDILYSYVLEKHIGLRNIKKKNLAYKTPFWYSTISRIVLRHGKYYPSRSSW